MRKGLLLVLVALTVIFSGCGKKGVKEVQESKQTNTPTVELNQFQKTYNIGHPRDKFEPLLKIIEQFLKKKGEFETTEAYNKRISEIKDCDTTNIQYFTIAKRVKYNIDKKLLEIFTVDDRDVNLFTSNYNKSYNNSIPIYYDIANSSEYEASNAYGMKFKVKKLSANDYNFKIKNKINKEYWDGSLGIKFSMNIEPEIAQQISEKIDYRLVFGVKFHSMKNTKAEFHYSKPTASDPNELFYNRYDLEVDLKEIILINIANCEIVKKITF